MLQDETFEAEGASILDVISTTRGFKPPTQARTREKTHAIMTAALDLLQERSYASIRIQDIADKAGCAVPAIYARFEDKEALLNAIHLFRLEQCRPLLDREISIERLKGSGLPGLARAFVDVNEHYFSENVNMVAAQLETANGDAYRVTAAIIDAYAARLSQVAAPLMGVKVEDVVASIRFAIHIILSIYRDSVRAASYFDKPSPEALAQLFVLTVEHRLTR